MKKWNYVLIYGSLLGAMRNKSIIPWTGDLDLAVINDVYDNKLHLAETKQDIWLYGYFLFHHEVYRLCPHRNHPDAKIMSTLNNSKKMKPYTAPYTDMYRLNPEAKSEGWYIPYLGVKNKPIHISFRTKVVLEEHAFPAPESPLDHVIYTYGNNFTLEKRY
ncbi:unnamed protein product [Didymodactylos carnosus]|uniref:LicD/FKTN/FKRP nucleotidyltransferase domain-containing protein n=1 Tax=Didymodactylos carnosus TaxID=1234261 RepID=A0A814XQ22_9BILA|nr:unnamed protein product [Didymodactylos carnosus]CAF3980980.1 unnamed protein product [Didymodactylos carnosus]